MVVRLAISMLYLGDFVFIKERFTLASIDLAIFIISIYIDLLLNLEHF